MGRELFPVAALRQWGAGYLFGDSNRGHAWSIGAPRCRTHRWVCSSADGEPLAPEDTQTVVRGPDSVGD
jgi:hypothetical protein